MSTALAAARAKTKGKRMLRDALDAYGDEDTSLSKWNARKKRAAEEGKWQWKESLVNTNAAIKARFDKEAGQTGFIDVQATMEAEMSNTIHLDQHGGQLLGPSDGREGQCCWRERIGGQMHYCTNLLPLDKRKRAETPAASQDTSSVAVATKRLCLWHALECSYSEHPMEKSPVIEIANEFGMCLHCYEVTAGTLRATLQKVPPRIGPKKVPGVCMADVRKEVKRDALLKHPGAGLSQGSDAVRKLDPTSVCAWQKEHSEINQVWRCSNCVLVHPVLRGSYLPFCGFHTPRCIQEYGNKGKKEQLCPPIDHKNRFGMCRNHLEAYLSSLSYEDRGSVLLIDSDFDVPGIKECRKEEVITSIARHPLAPKYPPPQSSKGPGLSMETTIAVAVLPSRSASSPFEKLFKKARAIGENLIRHALDHPNPMSVFVKEAMWRLQFMRRAELVAIRIQRMFRGRRARRRVRLLHYEQAALDRMKACRVLQRFVRGFLGRRRFEHEHQNVHQAVPHIQRLFRGALARKHFRELCAAIRLQRNFRLYRQRLFARTLREEVAYMQALQHQADMNYEDMEKQLYTFRRLRARRVLRSHMLRWKKRQELHDQEVAERLRSMLGTVKIQRQWRRYHRYKEIKLRYESARAIQRRIRGWLTRCMWQEDPGVEFVAGFLNERSGFQYGRVVIKPQRSKSYSYPSRKIRTRFGVLVIQRAFRGHLGRLTANTRWANMLKRWEWLGISPIDSNGQLSDSMAVGHQRHGLVLPSYAYHRDRKYHMRPIANDPLPDRGHAYKYQYMLDLINDRDGKRGWSLAKEEMRARQVREEQTWLRDEEARRSAKEAELAAKVLRKHVPVAVDPLARAMPFAKAIFPVGSLVDVAPKIRNRGKHRRAKIVGIHRDVGANGELAASFDIEYVKIHRNSYGRPEPNGEQRVNAARLQQIPLDSSEINSEKRVGVLIQSAIDSLRHEIQSKVPVHSTVCERENGQSEAIDALSTVDAIADRLRDCSQGFDLLYDQRDFVNFVFTNSTLLKLKWLQVVSHIRYGTHAKTKQKMGTDDNATSNCTMVAMLYREFGESGVHENSVIRPMPERARVIEQKLTDLGFQHDPSANIHEDGDTSDEDEAIDDSRRPETAPAHKEVVSRHSSVIADDMMLFREKQLPQSSQDLHRLIYELKTLPREAKCEKIIHIASRRSHAYICGYPACGKCFSSRKVARLHQLTSHEGHERLASANPLADQYMHTYWPTGAPWVDQKLQQMVGFFGCNRKGCEMLQFRTHRELSKHRMQEHGIKAADNDAESSAVNSSPASTVMGEVTSIKRSTTRTGGAIWLGPSVVCYNLESKLGIAAATLTSSRKCSVHNQPDQLCTVCFLEYQRPVSPFRLYSAVAVRRTGFRNSSIRIEVENPQETQEGHQEEEYMIFRDDDDEFCPAVNIWGVYSICSNGVRKRAESFALPDPFSTVLYMKVTTICRDSAGEAWIFGRVLAHCKRSRTKASTEDIDECEVVYDDKRGLSFALLSQVVGAASIHYCSKSLFDRKYCSQTDRDEIVPSALGLASKGYHAGAHTQKLFCQPDRSTNSQMTPQ